MQIGAPVARNLVGKVHPSIYGSLLTLPFPAEHFPSSRNLSKNKLKNTYSSLVFYTLNFDTRSQPLPK